MTKSKPLLGRYARIFVTGGTSPLESGMKLAGHVVALTAVERNQGQPLFVVRVVSNDQDDLPAELQNRRIAVAPRNRTSLSEAELEAGHVNVDLELLGDDEESVAHGNGNLVRLADDIPYEVVCPDCQGNKACDDCGGSGMWPNMTCSYCGGDGVCAHCGGKGFITESD